MTHAREAMVAGPEEIAAWMDRENVTEDWPQPEYRDVPNLLRSLQAEVERSHRLISLAHGLLENVEPETHLRPSNGEEWERLAEAEKITRHHIGEGEGGYCGLCVLQMEIDKFYSGERDV